MRRNDNYAPKKTPFERETARRRAEMLRNFANGGPLAHHQIPRGSHVLMALHRASRREAPAATVPPPRSKLPRTVAELAGMLRGSGSGV